jgi:pumilio RNA-binding family
LIYLESQNYVIQFILEHGSPGDRERMVGRLRGQMLQMARHKFASNVCEKALLVASLEGRRALIDEIMTPQQEGINPIATMMKDQYASESQLLPNHT